ncbi:hypothetical protein SCALIN_C13_0095 [Candidatus Scalindua japonica]|uniref:Uncharacterized protein n=1 Tax=Candidatus Scalindua japonica TaxID=1284222 RepID=A0A286TXG5_9BACT|nr:hypothetical protein [Candidatus Scalindua japonica]GAX60583.1 hypothetical protein SCALIN_C13_0095 [Candidatus Scalindua japonica]
MNKYLSVNILSIFFIIIISATVSCADDISAIAEDGRGVILHDDGTWEFGDLTKPVEVKSEEQAKELVKNLPCSRGGTVDQYLIKKAETLSVDDLGWQVYAIEDGFEVERLLLTRKKIESKYRWHVYKSGKLKPLNNKAIGITKE